MTKAIAQTYNTVHEHFARIALTVIVACLLLTFMYAINVFSIISRTVALQKVESQISTIGSSVNSLDTEYLHLSGRITPDNLVVYGMSQGKVSEYIPRTEAGGLGLNRNFNHVALGSNEF